MMVVFVVLFGDDEVVLAAAVDIRVELLGPTLTIRVLDFVLTTSSSNNNNNNNKHIHTITSST